MSTSLGSCWVLVTGASRGLGAAICEGISPLLGPGSVLVGVARSKERLDATAAKVKALNPNIKVITEAVDLSTILKEDFEVLLKGSFDSEHSPPPTKAIIFHNAASLENLTYLKQMKDANKITPYFHFNVSSVISLNAVFMDHVSHLCNGSITVVNISSLCALQPMKSWGLYCSAKAARDMVFRVMALEEPNIRVLNYAPGPLDNEMQVVARNLTEDEEVKSAFQSMKNENKLLTCSQSVVKLLDVLVKDEYKSGDHVDYYD
ncbi:hypothetical protein Pmani_029970 [Petrolisthes manimaculis]|uniref:Sepiapterin reductase n=1 Tax=Petrolisthes manimaculis TaxID=1843537 RepID=A0AAE1NX01_9EUCA|nr:hypothetical protein Pmani_029970 [Petrolisthes manimaculis]